MRLPPPVLAGIAGLTQLVLARRARPTVVSISAAAVLGSAAAGLGLQAVWGFHRQGTTINPENLNNSRALVTDGPNAWTRNPMYLAQAGILTSHAIYRRSAVGLLPVLGFLWAINRWQIPAEEAALRISFGADYETYVRRVPRWVLR